MSSRRRRRAFLFLAVSVLALSPSCFDRSTRWEEMPPPPPVPPVCEPGQMRCTSGLERCEAKPEAPGGTGWVVERDCAAEGLVCAPSLLTCTTCIPDQRACDGQEVIQCSADGSVKTLVDICDTAAAEACRADGCVHLCSLAGIERSNVGCEYWAVDLDNAMIDATSNAAAQQFAVVVSNPQPDVPVVVRIYQDDGAPGDAPSPIEIASVVLAPLNLQVFKLGPREVDGSPEGEYNTGTHTALTRHAYKIESNFPVVAYQFNPLENVNVFSNDASLLKPREAYSYEGESMRKAYVVAGWPQTIAATDDPNTNFNPANPIHLRSFLTIVGTREGTHVRVQPKAAVVGGGPVAETAANGLIEATLGAFDVLNLETGDFNADFTGTVVEADGPVAVFTGGEASDAPHFKTLADRRCCADHLEDQLDPVRAAGRRFAIAHTPSRTRAVAEAGAMSATAPEQDFVRFVAASSKGAEIKTTLPPPDDSMTLLYLGDFREVAVTGDFMAESSEAIIVEQVMASQAAAGVKTSLPGGDPSLLIMPPIEQFRRDYVFLTPDKYAFDFVSVVAPPSTAVALDDVPLTADNCWITAADGLTAEARGSDQPPFVVYTCQLSFGTIDPLTDPPKLSQGLQNDGVHRLVAGEPVGVLVSGFDSFVSYAYAGGTELREISAPE